MPISINGSGTISGISVGGLENGCVNEADLASAAVTETKLASNAVTLDKLGTTLQSQVCKAWVNFNGTGAVAIRSSYNVSSITDNGVGDYTVNFTTALADANFSIAGSATLNASTSAVPRILAPVAASGFSASNCQIRTADDLGTSNDCAAVCVAIFR
jgi:hypothetical protein